MGNFFGSLLSTLREQPILIVRFDSRFEVFFGEEFAFVQCSQ